MSDTSNSDFLLIFQARLRWAIKEKGWSARHTSEKAGLNESSVKKVLSSTKGTPNGDTVLKLAKALDVKYNWLMPDPDEIEAEEILAARKTAELLAQSRRLKGDRKAKILDKSNQLLEVFDPSEKFENNDDLIFDEGGNTRKATEGATIVHLVGYVGGDDGFTPFEDSITQILEAPAGTKSGTEAVEVWGDSMSPAFPQGTVLYYSQIAHPIAYYIGRPVIVELYDGRRLFKYLQKGKPGHYSLQSGDGTFIEENIKLKTVYPIDLVKY